MSCGDLPAIHSAKVPARLVLVPNRPVQQRLLAQSMADMASGEVRAAPAIEALSSWVEDAAVLLHQLAGEAVPINLDGLSELVAWMRLFSGEKAGSGHALGAARQARAADRLLRQWRLDGESIWLDADFFRLRQAMLRQQEHDNTFHAEDWLADFAARLDAGESLPIELPAEIALRGFVEFTAAEEQLLESLARRGVKLDRDATPDPASDVRVVECAHPEEEWQAAAFWIKSRLEAGAMSLCIVVPPGLSRSTSEWRRFQGILKDALEGHAAAMLRDGSECLHVPGGRTLGQLPVIDDAMRLLRLAVVSESQPIEFPELSRCLLSPHWAGYATERLPRARLELRLREREVYAIGRKALCRLIRNDRLEDSLGLLLECLEGLPSPEPGVPAGRWFHQVLRHWGWPGQVDADPAAKALAGILERLDTTAFNSTDEALRMLGVLIEEAEISPGSGVLAPVQVLDPETAAAGRFDATWVCHLDDSAWPPAVNVNPFLPGAARRDIPRLNPQGHLEYYTRLTGMLGASASEVRFSWSRDGGQGPRGPSPLLEQWPHEVAAVATTEHVAGAFEYEHDATGVLLPPDDPVDLPGGTEFFRLQAACPLAAYVRFRLGGNFPGAPGPFASARYRGELLHQALRALYANGRGERSIPDASEIGPAIEEALARARAGQRLSRAGLAAERGRLQRALSQWLELDSSRRGFKVESLEMPQALSLGRARLGLRIDRIDRLDDGRLFLIDYKSGGSKSRALKWTRERMQEPQLPVYAVMLEQSLGTEVGGLAIAVVKPFECAFDGISGDQGSAAQGIRVAGQGRTANLVPDWRQAMSHWSGQATMLAQEILGGYAANVVYDPDITAYTGLELVLRHGEVGELPEEAFDDD